MDCVGLVYLFVSDLRQEALIVVLDSSHCSRSPDGRGFGLITTGTFFGRLATGCLGRGQIWILLHDMLLSFGERKRDEVGEALSREKTI